MFRHVERERENESCLNSMCTYADLAIFGTGVRCHFRWLCKTTYSLQKSEQVGTFEHILIMCPKISQNHKQHVVGNAGRYQVSVWHFSAIPTSREHPDIESTDRYIQIASQAALLWTLHSTDSKDHRKASGRRSRRYTEKCWKSAVEWCPTSSSFQQISWISQLPASCLDLGSSRNTGRSILEDSDMQSTSCEQKLERLDIESMMNTRTRCDVVWILQCFWSGWKLAAAATGHLVWKSSARIPRGCRRKSPPRPQGWADTTLKRS